MKDQDVDDGLDGLVSLLPKSLRQNWVVAPRRAITKTYIIGLVQGAGIALFIVGVAFDVAFLCLVLPIAFLCQHLAVKYIPWWREDKELSQLANVENETDV